MREENYKKAKESFDEGDTEAIASYNQKIEEIKEIYSEYRQQFIKMIAEERKKYERTDPVFEDEIRWVQW